MPTLKKASAGEAMPTLKKASAGEAVDIRVLAEVFDSLEGSSM